MQTANHFLAMINHWFYSYILIGLLIFAGVYFTCRTKFVQIRLLPEAFRVLLEKKENHSAVSSFQALMISTASRVGTGNIAGVATAIAAGGPGSVFWMWLIALIGGASAFVESTLAQIYKVRDGDNGAFRGGPAYYIEQALGKRWLGILFSVLMIACFAYGFNPLQANNVVSALAHYFGGTYDSILVPAVFGIFLTAGAAYVIHGGQQKIAFISSVIVPVMAVLYMALGFFVLIRNIGAVPELLGAILKDAFAFRAASGGILGVAVMEGIKRGLFSNEAGMGSAPNAAAAAAVSHPVKQGLVQMLSVFIDTFLICSTSAFLILLSGVETAGLKAMPLMQKAVASQIGETGILFISVSVLFFAFTSIIGNYFYTEANLCYITTSRSVLTVFRFTVVAAVFAGCIVGYEFAWNLADVLMAFMTTINVISILLLSGIARKALSDYMGQRLRGKNPVFVAKAAGIDHCQMWRQNTRGKEEEND